MAPAIGEELVIEVRPSDGYFNATKMCASSGKSWGNYRQNQQTKQFLAKLCKANGLPCEMLVQSKEGGRLGGTWAHPSVADNLRHWCLREKKKRGATGYVYAVTSPVLNAVKIGMWHGSIGNLRARYITPYGSSLELVAMPVANCVKAEARLHEQFDVYRLDGELFCKSMHAEYLRAIENMREA